jgi:hypothetical protein
VTRTWDENREVINELWPMLELRPSERELWHDDLSTLDQDVLFEALREVKRSKDSPWPQLAWIHAAYNAIKATCRAFDRTVAGPPAYGTPRIVIDEEESRRLRSEFEAEIRNAEAFELDDIEARIWESFTRLRSIDAVGLVRRVDRRREDAACAREAEAAS